MENSTSIIIRDIDFFLKGYKKIKLSKNDKMSEGIIVARNIQNLIGEPLHNVISIE